jgi:hypothetical protein
MAKDTNMWGPPWAMEAGDAEARSAKSFMSSKKANTNGKTLAENTPMLTAGEAFRLDADPQDHRVDIIID